ncbi:MAG: hypothetical protein IJ571_04220 [Ruminococcus sp.]|nr:hypothetical protein [Ruminococcus sp.]
MAFETYTGYFTNISAVLQKLSEMWEFDSVESNAYTYGNAVLKPDSSLLYNGDTAVGANYNWSNSQYCTIAKTDKAVIVSTFYDNKPQAIVLGTVTNEAGEVSKGGMTNIRYTGTGTNYAVMGSNNSFNVGDTYRTTDGLTQLVPFISTTGGWCFEKVFKVIAGSSTEKSGIFNIGGERYFISGHTAIKES